MKFGSILIISFCLLFGESCSNILSSSAKVTDDSLMVDARISMNGKDFTAALADFQLMSAGYLAQRDVIAMNAAAYAGRCGLDFIGLVNDFTNIGSSTVLDVLYKSSVHTTASQEADCTSAEALMTSISASATSRTVAENLLLGLIEFQRVGVILGQYADQNGTGTIDSGFDPCHSSKGTLPATTGIPVVEAQILSASLMVGFSSLSASGIGAFSSSAASFQTYCTEIQTYTGSNVCAETTPSSFTNSQLQVLMGLVKTSFFGVGACADTTLATCICSAYP